MTTQTISAMEARKGFGELLNKVSLLGQNYIIKRAGKPLVVISPFVSFENTKTSKTTKKRTVKKPSFAKRMKHLQFTSQDCTRDIPKNLSEEVDTFLYPH